MVSSVSIHGVLGEYSGCICGCLVSTDLYNYILP